MELDEDTLLRFAVLTMDLRTVLNVDRFVSGNGLPRTCLAHHRSSRPEMAVLIPPRDLIWSEMWTKCSRFYPFVTLYLARLDES